MEALFILLFALLISVPLMIWRAFVITVLWGWFVVPQFGLQPLGMVSAIGLTAVVRVFTSHLNNTESDKDKQNESIAGAIANSILVPALALLTGWIVLQFR